MGSKDRGRAVVFRWSEKPSQLTRNFKLYLKYKNTNAIKSLLVLFLVKLPQSNHVTVIAKYCTKL